MPLSLLAGPANAGKVALLLERYLGALDEDPILIVPNRPDVDRAERELLKQTGGSSRPDCTFDDPSANRQGNGAHRPVVPRHNGRCCAASWRGQRRLGPSARFGGFAEGSAPVAELESALLEPGELEGELGRLYGAYRAELDRLGLWDRELERRHAAERAGGELAAWSPRPVFAYGFEDLTGAEWALLEVLAARAEVTVSLPYEPGRDAFASLSRTSEDLNALATTREELPPNPVRERPRLPISSVGSSARRAARRSSTARSDFSRAPACEERSSSWPRRCSRSCAQERIPPRSRSSAPPSTAGALLSTPRSRPSACPTRSRAACAWARRRSARR